MTHPRLAVATFVTAALTAALAGSLAAAAPAAKPAPAAKRLSKADLDAAAKIPINDNKYAAYIALVAAKLGRQPMWVRDDHHVYWYGAEAGECFSFLVGETLKGDGVSGTAISQESDFSKCTQ